MRRRFSSRMFPGSMRVNMTPMIDVTFLLLTFFMLASHFASAERTTIQPPDPKNSQAQDRRIPEKVIVNVSYVDAAEPPALSLGALPVDSAAELAKRLSEIARLNPNVEVILRADRRLTYGSVRSVMQVIAAQQLTRLQVVTQLETP